jgi:hypothetical protein
MHTQLLIINTNKKTNVFKVKYLERVMCSHGILFENYELALSGTFSNIVH